MKARPIRPSAREAILEAGIELLRDDPSASLSAIAVRAGVGRATLHRYFARREDLVLALSEQALRETDEAVQPLLSETANAREYLGRMFEVLIPIGQRYAFLQDETTNTPETTAHYQAQLQGLVELAEALRTEGDVDASVPSAWVASLIDSLIWTGWKFAQRTNATWEDAAALATRTVLGLRAP